MPSATSVSETSNNRIFDLKALAAGAISQAVTLALPRCRIAAVPGSGATVKVFKSASPPSLIAADAAAGRLTYANFNGGDLSTLSSNWALWAAGSATNYATEGTIDGSAWSAVIAISTGGTANLEIVQTP